MDGKLVLLEEHVVSYNGKEYTLLPGSILRIKDWNDQNTVQPADQPRGGLTIGEMIRRMPVLAIFR